MKSLIFTRRTHDLRGYVEIVAAIAIPLGKPTAETTLLSLASAIQAAKPWFD
ncbi:MAG: hypothetical protein SAL07_10960 [Oscillatoria sp. PMC 1051.18]|nr:hypothetical protein [Oscillatoria sp. PMC 1050.18]MEC5030424.1 hypothetical protein [Oscillatoria sp. PMC 1051.18]